jgi:hypothetical protein
MKDGTDHGSASFVFMVRSIRNIEEQPGLFTGSTKLSHRIIDNDYPFKVRRLGALFLFIKRPLISQLERGVET